jgi:hypothetical protein
MSNPRDVVVEHLEANLPGVLVKPYGAQVENLAGDLVMVRLDEVVPGQVKGLRSYTGSLLCASGTTAEEKADLDVDDLLEDVLDVIDKTAGVTWSKAARATLDETWPAWEVTVTYPIVQSVSAQPTP